MPVGKTPTLHAFEPPAPPPLDVRPLATVRGQTARLPPPLPEPGPVLTVLWQPRLPPEGTAYAIAPATLHANGRLRLKEALPAGTWILHVEAAGAIEETF